MGIEIGKRNRRKLLGALMRIADDNYRKVGHVYGYEPMTSVALPGLFWKKAVRDILYNLRLDMGIGAVRYQLKQLEQRELVVLLGLDCKPVKPYHELGYVKLLPAAALVADKWRVGPLVSHAMRVIAELDVTL
jgi:hypothetical protein